MARLTHRRRDLVLDGFAGDVVFRAKDYYADVVAAPDHATARQIMYWLTAYDSWLVSSPWPYVTMVVV
ncbi:hypothetical protein Aple_052350 [Acrocarpospora pleiomorpha]|uniref:Uncharacterized protein n=1 Tax=Acrocarpospora pleiomorpha TaxID=90975 RepID=A0A5M3XVA8_9ACTN|nr:hypothetical protein [Acrocarpospora pleiomorpha]GES22338.1 hypothetical protein Aple_052350 [Acrocarpospora pleiomorpha]